MARGLFASSSGAAFEFEKGETPSQSAKRMLDAGADPDSVAMLLSASTGVIKSSARVNDDSQLEAEVAELHRALEVMVNAISEMGGVQKLSNVDLARARYMFNEIGKEAARLTPIIKQREAKSGWRSKGLGLFRG
jgi:hypothetical protein